MDDIKRRLEEGPIMGRCKDCKHYVPEDDEGAYGAQNQGQDEPAKHVPMTCKHPKFLIGYGHSFDEMAPDGLMIENDEGWAWVVGPEFGCVHFEQHEGTE